MKTSTAIILALALLAPAAFADNNTGAVSGNNNELYQATGNGVINAGNGAGAVTAQGGAGGAGGTATARSGDSSVIASGNSFNSNTTGSQTATTGNQSVNVSNPKQHRQAPAVLAPGLANGFDCNGSSSTGVSFPLGGVSHASTEANVDCVRMRYASIAENPPKSKAAMALLCMNKDFRQAMKLEETGCPELPGESIYGDEDDIYSIEVPLPESPSNGSRNR